MAQNPDTPSSVKDEDASFWLKEIEAAKSRGEKWRDKAKQAIERYQDKKDRAFGSLNILWANVEVQKAALGDDFGKPQVSRINAPEEDGGLTRQVSLVWERSIDAAVKDTNDNHDIRLAVHDILLPGRGQVWLELLPHEDGDGNITWVEAPLVRVQYDDYLEGPANRWGEVPWVARRHLFTLDDLKIKGFKNADKIPRNYRIPTGKDEDKKALTLNEEKGQEQFRRAAVWEIWAKFPQKRRIYIAENYEKALKVDADPYRLKKFFPCPRPILANGDEGWQEPLTDYSRYQDQAEELDRVSQRIFVLTEILKNRGVYDKKFRELADLQSAGDNVYLGVDNFAELMQKGGLAQVLQPVDLQPIALVLAELHKQRRELIQLIYELTGISDLARGMTDPNETATAQKMKMTFGSGRFQDRQKESRRFAAEAYALKGELLAEHFPREQVQEMCGIQLPLEAEVMKARRDLQAMQQMAMAAQEAGQPLPPFNPRQIRHLQKLAATEFTWEDISGVLQSDYRRCYTVDVETDQTAFRDEEADKQARIELLGVVNQLMQQFGPMIAGNPANGEIVKQFLMFVVSAFKAGRAIEEGIEQAIDNAIEQAQKQSQQPQQDPKAMADAQIAQARIQTAQVGLQTAQVRLQEAQVRAQAAGANIQTKIQESQIKVAESAQKVQTQQMANQAKAVGHQIDIQNKAEQLEFERERRATAQETILAGPTQPTAQNGAV